ncbi:hypothetical protein GQ55_3G143800 [Panicum hallii var. hallii]|uniref:Uncharacterized protein n=1 Tax=Panicum hallii var. hallii TaxID=1504633 RepID=A0A2T7E9F3_9POAL|nr:hypothetical protein GQ55_3G143800 [Panicum hallii var. hallii]
MRPRAAQSNKQSCCLSSQKEEQISDASGRGHKATPISFPPANLRAGFQLHVLERAAVATTELEKRLMISMQNYLETETETMAGKHPIACCKMCSLRAGRGEGKRSKIDPSVKRVDVDHSPRMQVGVQGTNERRPNLTRLHPSPGPVLAFQAAAPASSHAEVEMIRPPCSVRASFSVLFTTTSAPSSLPCTPQTAYIKDQKLHPDMHVTREISVDHRMR